MLISERHFFDKKGTFHIMVYMVTAFTIQNVNIRLVRVDETKDVLINFEKRR